MNKKYISFFSLLIIMAFIGYIIYDTSSDSNYTEDELQSNGPIIPDQWIITSEIFSDDGDLTCIAVGTNGTTYLGGDSYISSYDIEQKKLWVLKTAGRITSLTAYGDTIFGSTNDLIFLISPDGKLIDEWGPFEDNSIITSLATNRNYLVFTDAGNKMVFVLTKDGRVKSMFGQSGEKFIIPSPYFDVEIDEKNTLFIANTGHRRVETRNIDGDLISFFGSPGTAPGAFSGCCNPAHFTGVPGGFVTAEKGLNRIKIVDEKGEFVEYVSANNNFTNSIPLDLDSPDGKTIYAANPADSKLYVFKRRPGN